ncbi:MAG: GNAT family N-acetyltransferase [Flammeovirgaceae bacterium]|nr:GNAT family N-acetyltransferase [Flammeovirgaceae bacterium]
MEAKINIQKLNSNDLTVISKIADWYLAEWDTPRERTISRFSSQPNQDVLFQLVLSVDNKLKAAGGIAHKVEILKVHKKLIKYQPWVALLYVAKDFRNRGLGKMLLEEIEECAKEQNLKKIYLYTFTAESLYKKCGWKVIERVLYKGHNTVVMEKEI